MIQENEASLLSTLHTHGLPASKRMGLPYSLFKGASVQLDAVSLDPQAATTKIASIVPVKNVWPVMRYQNPEPGKFASTSGDKGNLASVSQHVSGSAADTEAGYAPHVSTQIDKLHAEGYTGKGIRVGVIDSGVGYKHPVLGGCFGEGCIVGYGMDLIGPDFNGTNTPVPGPFPYPDRLGHGTHVSGIIAAQKNSLGFIGAAHGVTLGMYEALDCGGGSSNDVLTAAFNQAYEDGSDVISISIGVYSGWKGTLSQSQHRK